MANHKKHEPLDQSVHSLLVRLPNHKVPKSAKKWETNRDRCGCGSSCRHQQQGTCREQSKMQDGPQSRK